MLTISLSSSEEAGGGSVGLRLSRDAQRDEQKQQEQQHSHSMERYLVNDDQIEYYKEDDANQVDYYSKQDDEVKQARYFYDDDVSYNAWVAGLQYDNVEEASTTDTTSVPSSITVNTSKVANTAYIVSSKIQAWESNAITKVHSWESTANTTAWEFYSTPLSQWTSRQWELAFDISLGLFAILSLSILLCLHCCCIQDVDDTSPRRALPLSYFKRRKIRSSKHSNNNNNNSRDDGTDEGSYEASSVDLGPDYDNLDTTDSLVEYVSVMRKRSATHKPVDSWEESTSMEEQEQHQRPPLPDIRLQNQYQSSPAASLLLSSAVEQQQSPASMVSSVSNYNNSQLERCVSWDKNVKDVIAKPKITVTNKRKMKMRKNNKNGDGGGDRLLEARDKHNLVGYYL